MTRFAEMHDAKDIHQAHLDVLSSALLAGDSETFAEGVGLPYMALTHNDTIVIETRAHLDAKFLAYHRSLKAQGVTEYARMSTSAVFEAPDVISGEHETHILRGGLRLVEPYRNRIRLERVDGAWIETVAANGVQGDQARMLFPRPVAKVHPLPPLEIREDDA